MATLTRYLVREVGFEPTTFSPQTDALNQLSYSLKLPREQCGAKGESPWRKL